MVKVGSIYVIKFSRVNLPVIYPNKEGEGTFILRINVIGQGFLVDMDFLILSSFSCERLKCTRVVTLENLWAGGR